MSLNNMISQLPGYQPIREIQGFTERPKTEATKTSGVQFSEVFNNVLHEVDGLQKEADSQIEGLVLEKEGVTTHGAMLALEKADVAFQLMNNIRAKIIRAYEDIIRTAV